MTKSLVDSVDWSLPEAGPNRKLWEAALRTAICRLEAALIATDNLYVLEECKRSDVDKGYVLGKLRHEPVVTIGPYTLFLVDANEAYRAVAEYLEAWFGSNHVHIKDVICDTCHKDGSGS